MGERFKSFWFSSLRVPMLCGVFFSCVFLVLLSCFVVVILAWSVGLLLGLLATVFVVPLAFVSAFVFADMTLEVR